MLAFCVAVLTKIIYTFVTGLSYSVIADATSAVVSELLILIERRPIYGVVAECMRRSRLTYHYAIRKVRKDEQYVGIVGAYSCIHMLLNGLGLTLLVSAVLLMGFLITRAFLR